MISFDTETTGVDFRHGARPFFVTTCNEDGDVRYWEWDVDPLTRKPIVSEGDVSEVCDLINEADALVLQNPKFDVTAMMSLAPTTDWDTDWPWAKTYDTLLAGHLLASNRPHNLTDMAMQYLRVDIEPYEKRLQKCVEECRRWARSHRPTWQIAKAGRPDMPSAKEKCWKYDTWLPRAVAMERGEPVGHPYWTVLEEYANTDSATTLALWQVMRSEIERRKLWNIYQERLRLLPIAYKMESRGVSLSLGRLDQLEMEYKEESDRCATTCLTVAAAHRTDCECKTNPPLPTNSPRWAVNKDSIDETHPRSYTMSCSSCGGSGTVPFALTLPKSGNNKSLSEFCFGPLGLRPVKRSKQTGAPSLDKASLDHYAVTLEEGSKAHKFVVALRDKRKRDTAMTYMDGYRRFLIELSGGYCVLHPSLNPTGTDTLRWSSANPNEQNISKQEGFNLRYAFGPAPGREWWSLDAKNIELRIPAYESGEQEMIDLFERPDDAPYYGSNHLLIAHVLWPKEFEECRGEDGQLDGRIFKKKYASTLYQWTKNGNFAVQYGAVEASGTADRAYHQQGAQRKVMARFQKMTALNQKWVRFADKNGFVETLPDKSIDPARGYPILCSRTEQGHIQPTVPLNYHVQSTAMWWTARAMVRCDERLEMWRDDDGFDGFITMQVHDEMVFDFPAGRGAEPWRTNFPRIRALRKLMERGGDDIGVPTPVGVEYHANNWSEGLSL